MIKPNYEDCQCCTHWDDVNGCWKDSSPDVCGELEDEDDFIEDFSEDEEDYE